MVLAQSLQRSRSDERLKLHLGCGKRQLAGFVHVDLDDHPHIDVRSDVRDLSAFDDGCAELVYASHVLEYFDRTEVIAVLHEWRRVLCPGGTLRLAVPDFPALVQVYQKTGELERILGPLYGRIAVQTPEPNCFYHRTAYDLASLTRVLEAAGFCAVRPYAWQDSVHRDTDDHSQAYFPHMDKQHGLLVSLNVEANRP